MKFSYHYIHRSQLTTYTLYFISHTINEHSPRHNTMKAREV